MKKICSPLILSSILSLGAVAQAQLVQTFETGEDTSNWGSTWSNGSIVPTFLDPSLGGSNAGGGGSVSQSFSRSFKNNTAGVDVTEAYSLGLYIQLDSFDGPAGGQFEIVDGSYGTGNAANLRVLTEEVSPGIYEFHWQARDNNLGWLDFGLNLDLSQPYYISLQIDPDNFTYSAEVQSVDTAGNVLVSEQLLNLAFDQNVINNGQNGQLLFYIQASAGGAGVEVDNINISTVPEPSTFLLVGLGLGGVFLVAGSRRKVRYLC